MHTPTTHTQSTNKTNEDYKIFNLPLAKLISNNFPSRCQEEAQAQE